MALRDGLLKNEHIVKEVKISKAAVLMIWISIPAVFAIFFLTIELPILIRSYINSEIKNLLMDMLGLENMNFSQVVFHLNTVLRLSLPSWLVGFITFLSVLLFIVWVCWASVMTVLHFRYELLLTDRRIMGRTKNNELECEWEAVNNIFVERSVWGKLFHYGTLTVQTRKGAITIKQVSDPDFVLREFKTRCQDGTSS